jgi:AcrR family transcriptional regulator
VTRLAGQSASAHPSSDRGDATRRRILEATISLVAEVGWAAVTTRSVARRAGITQGLIHYHFASKEALLRTAVVSAFTAMIAGPTEVLAASGELGAGLRAIVDELDAIDSGSPLMLVSAEALALALRDPELGAWMRDELTRFRAALADLLRSAGARGATRTDISPEAAAVVVAALLDGLLFHKAVDPGLDLATSAAALETMLAAPASPNDRRAHRS